MRDNEKETLALRRYILGLSLTAITSQPAAILGRVVISFSSSDKRSETVEVYGNGKRLPITLTHKDSLEYTKAVAKEFGINPERNIELQSGPDRVVDFDKDLAKKDVSDAGDGGKKPKKTSALKAK